MSEPTGFEPQGSILLPSWRSTTTEVYAHVPTSWALEIFVWAIEAPDSSPVKRHSSAAVAAVSKRDRFIDSSCSRGNGSRFLAKHRQKTGERTYEQPQQQHAHCDDHGR